MARPWDQAAATFRSDLLAAVDGDVLKELHVIRPWRHVAVVLRQLLVLAAAVIATVLWGDRWYVWIPCSIVIGFVVFSFSVLLHEVVHNVALRDRRSRWNRVLGHLYAFPSGLSATQFTRWHLDHHDNLGTDDGDPKRHYLTPKIVRRWFKALYFTPALFPIYFRAARRAGATYPDDLRRKIRNERRLAIGFHLAVPLVLWLGLGRPDLALKLHLIPVFVVFPVAFALNRLGQHYDIDPADPAKWGTVIRPSPYLWDVAYLWSNYHVEHHYFPKVPFYNLPRLHQALGGFFAERGMRKRTYGGLLFDWLVRNRVPHTRWSDQPAG